MVLMLDVMRKHSKSFLIYVLFGIIIVVFIISFGPGSECAPKGEVTAAEINGRRVPITEFENIYNHDPRFQFRDRREDTADLRQAAMDALVEREILAQEAERLGLRVSNRELARRIRSLAWWQKDGKFDMEYYKRWVSGVMNSSIPAFEERLRKDFLGEDLRRMVLTTVQVSDTEVEAEWRNRNAKVDLEFVEIDPAEYRSTGPLPATDVQQWKEKNRKKLEEHWSTKRFLYFARKLYHLRQIALKVPPAADPAARDALKRRLEEIRKEVEGGKDFAALAGQYSQDPATREKGGDLGFLERKQMPTPEMRKFATETVVGKVSPVFCDSEFCRIVKVEATRERELKELEDEIAQDLLREERASAAARERAEAILAKLKADPKADLKALAPKRKAPATAAERRAAAEKKERQKKLREALRKAMAKKPGMKVDEPKDDAERGPYGQTGPFGRARNFLVPKVGISKELMRAAFQLKKKGEVAPRLFEVDKKFYVVRLFDRTEVGKPTESDLEGVRRELLTLKQIRLYETWLDDLRKRARVSVNRLVLKPPTVRKPTEEERKPAPAKGEAKKAG
jgi:peptidyl-prolyl cis-trans isomerase D